MKTLRMLARTRFTVADGYPIPRGWGVAFARFEWRDAVVLPVPLNLIVGVVVAAWWRAKGGVSRTWLERHVVRAWRDGYEEGRRDAHREAIDRQLTRFTLRGRQ